MLYAQSIFGAVIIGGGFYGAAIAIYLAQQLCFLKTCAGLRALEVTVISAQDDMRPH